MQPAGITTLAPAIMLTLGVWASAGAEVLNVPADFSTIQVAIDAAEPGDSVLVAPGTYYENSITVTGSAPFDSMVVAQTVVDGEHAGTVFAFVNGEGPDARLAGLTIQNGQGAPWPYEQTAGGITCRSHTAPRISDCVIRNCAADYGGGAYSRLSKPIFTRCRFENNVSTMVGGGIAAEKSSVWVIECSFAGNSSEKGGGFYLNDHDHDEGSLQIINCSFAGNTSSESGGGLYLFGIEAATVSHCRFVANTSKNGGGIISYGSTLELSDCIIADNSAESVGGGFYDQTTALTMNDCVLTDNSAGYRGGGLFVYSGTQVFTSCTFIGNSAETSGGGAYFDSFCRPWFRNCVFRANAGRYGGGVYFDGSFMTITQCGFFENQATGRHGGALSLGATVVTYNSVFSNNSATEDGGAVRAWSSLGDVRFYDCIFNNNSSGGNGGAFALDYCDLLVDHCTLVDNDAGGDGGAIYGEGTESVVTNSIVWGTTAPALVLDDWGWFTVEQSDVQGGWPGDGNIDADPLFITHDGFDYLLGIGSPCIDAGSGADDAVDWCSVHPFYCQYNTQAPDLGAYGGQYNAGWMP